ncbi:PolC-type DNA polymerase III [Aquitalea denitrificans]|uniref:3'-5' exonuclease n=1 Tax=Aquitalea denitrificans TaxID=519081 RepID=UPI0013590553|nr:3'-5' exonuclease [Aquitalea denitrificans]
MSRAAPCYAVLDFETSGLSPAVGSRVTEVAVVLWQDGRELDSYQSLMNAGVRVPAEIERLTGISNAMLRTAPPAATVMREVADFVGNIPLVAHNAAFDRKFWDHELSLLGRQRQQDFACTLLLARRLLPQAPDHKLGTLTRWAGLPDAGRAHRALADARMAAHLLQYLLETASRKHGARSLSHQQLCQLQKASASKVGDFFRQSA